MIKNRVPFHELVLLQSYLQSIFSLSKKCDENFNYTKWYFNAKYTENEIREIINSFIENEIKNDCGVLKRLNGN